MRSPIRRWRANNREATLENLPHQSQSVLHLLGGHWKTAENECQCTEVVRRSTEGSFGWGGPRRVMAVRDTGIPSTSDEHGLTPEHTGCKPHRFGSFHNWRLIVLDRYRYSHLLSGLLQYQPCHVKVQPIQRRLSICDGQK